MAGVIGLAHAGVFVDDLERSQKFYRDILGFETTWECEFSDEDNTYTVAFVSKAGVVLELVKRKHADERTDGVTDHVALLVDDLADMMALLGGKGVEFETQDPVYCADMMPNGTKWIFFRGPDGEHIELTEIL
jgi:lactoylglutathione lyase